LLQQVAATISATRRVVDSRQEVDTVARMRIFLLIAITLTPGFSAELTNTEQIIAFSSAKSVGYKSFSADFSQSINMMGMAMNFTGHMIYKEPQLLRMEADLPMMGQSQKIVCVSDSNRIVWTEMSMGSTKRVMKMDGNRLAANASQPASPLKNVDPRQQWQTMRERYNLTFAGVEELKGQPLYVLEGVPKLDAKWSSEEQAVAQFIGKSRVYIGQHDGFLHKLHQFDKSGTNIFMSLELDHVKFNEDFPASTFVYTPSEGVQVIDITSIAEQMQQGNSAQPESPHSDSGKPALKE
jgi:outer membrane lipoprotein-sorting protein